MGKEAAKQAHIELNRTKIVKTLGSNEEPLHFCRASLSVHTCYSVSLLSLVDFSVRLPASGLFETSVYGEVV